MSEECRQIPIAGSDTNGEGAGLLEQLPHGLSGGLPRHPAADPFADLAFLDGVIVPHQLGQGIQESSESCHLVPALCCITLRPGLRPPNLILFALHPLQVGGSGGDGMMA